MKKFILNLLKFSFFLVIFYVLGLCIWSWFMPPFMAKNVRNCIGCYGHLNTRIKELPKYKNVDILVLGSSHAYRGFDPRIFKKHGIYIYNLGSSSQTPVQTNILLNQYVNEIHPKLVVMEVYTGSLEMDGVESSLDLAANNKIDWNYMATLPYIRNLNTYNSTIYGFFRDLMGLNESFVEDSIQGNDHYIKGGYVESEFKKNEIVTVELSGWKLNETQMKFLMQNIDLLKEKNIPHILVQTPITSYKYNSKINNKEIEELLSGLGHFKNFQNEFYLNDTVDFYDSNHLNQQGVEKFNEFFIEYLLKNKLIPNHQPN